MSKVTSKLQVTVPKAIADQYGIRPGDEIEWIPAGDSIRVVPARPVPLDNEADIARRVALFDAATERQLVRDQRMRDEGRAPDPPGTPRGWTREDLYYDRGRGRPD